MPRLALACHCLAGGFLVVSALGAERRAPFLRAASGRRSILGKHRVAEDEAGSDSIAAEDRALMAELEAAYGGRENLWKVQTGMCGKCVSDEDQQTIMRENKEATWSAGIYGEITPDAFSQMLRLLHVRPGMRFYDLGSGTGKTIAIAAHIFQLNATGIELSKDRHNAGCTALAALQRSSTSTGSKASDDPRAELVRGSFFDYDFSDAEVIFMDSVEFTEAMMARIAELGRSLKKGTRIATWKNLPGEDYRHVDTMELKGTWGGMAVQVFEKTTEPRPPLALTLPSRAAERCEVTLPRHESV